MHAINTCSLKENKQLSIFCYQKLVIRAGATAHPLYPAGPCLPSASILRPHPCRFSLPLPLLLACTGVLSYTRRTGHSLLATHTPESRGQTGLFPSPQALLPPVAGRRTPDKGEVAEEVFPEQPQLCRYAGMQVCGYAVMQVCRLTHVRRARFLCFFSF